MPAAGVTSASAPGWSGDGGSSDRRGGDGGSSDRRGGDGGGSGRRGGDGRNGGCAAGEPPRGQIAEIQRSRLLAGALAAAIECGYADVTVADITSRARVSRRTFYELFANCEECLAAALDDALALLGQELRDARLERLAWRERVRTGLWIILCFLDREPALARICVVQTLRGGPRTLAHRERALGALVRALDEGRQLGTRVTQATALTAEGLVGAAMAILHARLLRDELPLRDLLGELMGMIVLPYLGPAAARREQTRRSPRAIAGAPPQSVTAAARATGDLLDGVEMRLTYRTTRVLEVVAESPGASNRRVAEGAGIQDQGQVSKLLARLQRLGLLANAAEGHPGEPNAWSLTSKGKGVAQSIGARALAGREAA
jgi:AcrR family transcriptional regulator